MRAAARRRSGNSCRAVRARRSSPATDTASWSRNPSPAARHRSVRVVVKPRPPARSSDQGEERVGLRRFRLGHVAMAFQTCLGPLGDNSLFIEQLPASSGVVCGARSAARWPSKYSAASLTRSGIPATTGYCLPQASQRSMGSTERNVPRQYRQHQTPPVAGSDAPRPRSIVNSAGDCQRNYRRPVNSGVIKSLRKSAAMPHPEPREQPCDHRDYQQRPRRRGADQQGAEQQ